MSSVRACGHMAESHVTIWNNQPPAGLDIVKKISRGKVNTRLTKVTQQDLRWMTYIGCQASTFLPPYFHLSDSPISFCAHHGRPFCLLPTECDSSASAIFCAHKLFGTEHCREEDGRLCSDIYRTSGRTDWPDGRNSLPCAANFLFFTTLSPRCQLALQNNTSDMLTFVTFIGISHNFIWLSNFQRGMGLIAVSREFTIRYSHFSGRREYTVDIYLLTFIAECNAVERDR